MKQVVVADTGPLIILAGINQLSLLPDMYGSVVIPEAVYAELRLGSSHRETEILAQGLQQEWLKVLPVDDSNKSTLQELQRVVDPGEAEAILLAEALNCRFLLIDDRKGRIVAAKRGLTIVGVAGILLAAKQRQRIEAVCPLIHEMRKIGYRLSRPIVKQSIAVQQ
jgi:predicted nucleic acid-binding protein